MNTRIRTIISLLLLSLISTAINAEDWYFRPKLGGPYLGSDGTTYDSAWFREQDIVWGLAGIAPGDTLYICGIHDAGYDDGLITVETSGSLANPIVIDGNCPMPGGGFDQGFLIGAGGGQQLPVGWAGPDELGVYSRAYLSNATYQLVEKISPGLGYADPNNPLDDLRRLTLRTDLPSADWKCGSFSQLVQGGTLYYKPSSSGIDPTVCDTPHIIYPPGFAGVSVVGRDNIHLRNIFMANSSKLLPVYNSNGFRMENSELRWNAFGGAINITNDSDNGVLLNNTFRDSSNGIYFVSASNATNSDGWLVSGNHIFNIDQDGWYCDKDAHGIGIQGGNNSTFEYNHIHDIGGTGITFFSFGGQEQMNNVIRYNRIHDVKDLTPDQCGIAVNSGRLERGIDYHRSNPNHNPDDTVGNVVHHNVVWNIDRMAFRSTAMKSILGPTWSFHNNTVYNCGTSFAMNEFTPGDYFISVTNNIFMNPVGPHISQEYFDVADDHSGIEINNNLFYPDGAPGESRFEWAGMAYATLAEWVVASGKGPNPAPADPLFVDPSNPNPDLQDFHLLLGSPAINAGADVGLTEDFDGNPIIGLPDIGAYEFVDTDGDGVFDDVDNCINDSNPNQGDDDGDGIGNVCDIEQVTLTSIAAEDGWVRESSETSNLGGKNNITGAGNRAIRFGDHKKDRQYKAVVSFDTSGLAAGATVLGAQLELIRGTDVGNNDPYTTLGTAYVDLSVDGFGGSPALANSDFEAAATVIQTGQMSDDGSMGTATLDAAGLSAIEGSSKIQLRIQFSIDDNDDRTNDYAGYYSANNSNSSNHPRLIVDFTLPD